MDKVTDAVFDVKLACHVENGVLVCKAADTLTDKAAYWLGRLTIPETKDNISRVISAMDDAAREEAKILAREMDIDISKYMQEEYEEFIRGG